MLRISTGLAKAVCDTGSIKGQQEGASGFVLDIYSGPRPAAPDDAVAVNNAKLVTVSNNGAGTGIHFDTLAPGGVLVKAPGETWAGTILADGTGAWFRLREVGDAGTGASATAKRIDGVVAVSGGDLDIDALSFITGAPFSIASASFTFPRGV